LLGQGELSSRQAGEAKRADLDERLQVASTDQVTIDASTEVQEARERAKGVAERNDVVHGFHVQAADCAQRHTNRSNPAWRSLVGLPLGGMRLNFIPIHAQVDARWQDQHAPAPWFFDGGPEAEMGGAAVVERLAEERRRGRRIHLGAGLQQTVCHRARSYIHYLALRGYIWLDWDWLLAIARHRIWELDERLGLSIHHDAEALVQEAIRLGYFRNTAIQVMRWTLSRLVLHAGDARISSINDDQLDDFC
jgi:hypothetical protein